MTPDQFLRQLQKQGPAPAYLFIGPDFYVRDQCRRALIAAALPPDETEQGFSRVDLDEVELADALDDARTLSLFASRRVIWIGSAEGALPRGRAAAASASDDDDESAAPSKKDASLVAGYMKDPSPGTVLVFDCSRFEFDGDDKARIERVQKFYSAVPNQVEFRQFDAESATTLAQNLARKAGLQIGSAEVAALVDALACDASRIASEIEKLSLFAGDSKRVTAADIARLVPNAQENTVFELVAALGSGNRARSLTVLDALVRAGEYLPLALSFLATQFRQALVAREAGLRTAADIQAHFTRLGSRMWRDRAEQVRQTLQAFPKEKLETALKLVAKADRDLRDARPDDRIVIEQLILTLTEPATLKKPG
jgi:DNA polymerase III subunit delta